MVRFRCPNSLGYYIKYGSDEQNTDTEDSLTRSRYITFL